MGHLKEYNELIPIVRRLVRIRIRPFIRISDSCGGWKNHTHIHITGLNAGLLHLAHKDLNLSRDGKAALLIHEFIHIKNKTGYHTRRFWKLQREFITDSRWHTFFTKEGFQ